MNMKKKNERPQCLYRYDKHTGEWYAVPLTQEMYPSYSLDAFQKWSAYGVTDWGMFKYEA